MVTEHTNTVYNCAGCGTPLAWRNGTSYAPPGWRHITLPMNCRGLEPVAIRLPVPARAGVS